MQYSRIVSMLAALAILFLFRGTVHAQEEDWRWSRIVPTGGEQGEIPIELPRVSGIVTNTRIHPTTTTTQSEMSIAVHPLNPNILFAGSNAAGSPTVTYISQGWYVSTNGGESWVGSDRLPPHLNHPGGLSNYMSDPAVGIDRNGVLHFNALLYDGIWKLVVTRSTNTGDSWTNFAFITSTSANDPDKNHLAIDNTSGTYSGYVYSAYSEFVTSPFRIRFSRSTNAGQSWSTPAVISTGTYLDQGVNLQIGTNGEIYAAWSNYTSYPTQSNISFNKSTNGGANWVGVSNAVTNVADLRGYLVKGGYSIRVSSFPSMVVDHSNTARRGWLYLVYPERVTSAGPDIKLIRSTNAGASWSSPVRVNQDNTTRDQWYPWCTVDPSTGVLYIVYYDSRNFTNNDSAQVYVTYSLDGGESFQGEILASDAAFLPRRIPGLASGYMGDYIGIVAANGWSYACWNDNRIGTHQAYVGKIGVPTSFTNRIGELNAGGSFTINGLSVPSGESANLSPNSTTAARTDNERFTSDSSYKHHDWNHNSTNWRLNRSFTASLGSEQSQNTYFFGLNPAVVKTDLIDGPSTSGGSVEFRDPWYLADAFGSQPNTFFTYPSPYSPTGAYNQMTGGVFLNQRYDIPGNPYYSVGAPSQQIGNFTWNFVNWTTTQGSASFQDANAAQTGVVFQSANTTVAARMKAHLASTSATATAPNNQRKISAAMSVQFGFSIVYASANRIWGIAYDGTGPDVPISSEAIAARDPSIDNQEDGYCHIVWEEVQGTYTHSIKYQKVYGDISPAGPAETIYTWTSGSDYRATPVISFGQRLIGQASPDDENTDFEYLIVAWRGNDSLQVATRQLVPSFRNWTVNGVPLTNSSSQNPAVAAQVSTGSTQTLSAYLVWEQNSRIYFWRIRPTDTGAIFDDFADISSAHRSNAAPSVWAVYTGIQNDWFHPVVAWHAWGPLQDRPYVGSMSLDPTIFTRERVGDQWVPSKEIEHGTHSMQYATIGYDRQYTRLGVFFQCASHIGFADANPSNDDKWDGNWGWSGVLDLAPNASSPNGVMHDNTWLSLWMPAGQSPYPITLASGYGLSPGNMANMKPFAGARQGAGVTTDARSGNDGGRASKMNAESPAESLFVQPQASSRSGAVDLSRINFVGWGSDVLRGIISFEAAPHELVTQNRSERMRFAPADPLNLFAEWLGTEAVTVPASAQRLRSSGSVSISRFEVVTPPPANLNPVVFRLVLLDVGRGKTLATLGEMRLRELIALGRRDTIITRSFTLPLVQHRGRSARVDLKIIGQEESFDPVFWETYLTPVEATTPLVPMASGRAQKAEATTLPASYLLEQNYPNPFNPATAIRFQLPVDTHVLLKLYDVLGQEVSTLVDEVKAAGYYEVTLDASALASGMYLYRMLARSLTGGVAGDFVAVKKLLLMK